MRRGRRMSCGEQSFALQRPLLTQATGLQLQQSKYACYSRGYDLTTCPWRELVGAALGGETTPDGVFTHGVMIGGVPVELGTMRTCWRSCAVRRMRS